MDKRTGWALAGLGAAALLGVGAFMVAGEKGAERPKYRRIRRDGSVELRAYPELTLTETVVVATREEALGRGFQRLADYIFAKSRSGDPIAMTAPVLSEPAGEGGGWRTRFIMPSRYTLDDLPAPGVGIALTMIPAREVAAIQFNGHADDAKLAAAEAELRAWLADRGYAAAGPAEHAFYNSPFMPGALRRNEVLIPLAQAEVMPGSSSAGD